MIFVTSFTIWRLHVEIFSFFLLQGKASGNEAALWLRAPIQYELFKLGCRLQKHAGKVLFLGILILAILSVGMKSATLETSVEKLWIQGKKKYLKKYCPILPPNILSIVIFSYYILISSKKFRTKFAY